MDKAEDTNQLSAEIQRAAMQTARDRANVARWDLNIAIFLFAILIIIMILLSRGMGINVVAPLAIFRLATVWFVGWRRGRQLYQRFYDEEISKVEREFKKTIRGTVKEAIKETVEETIEEKVQKALRERWR